MTYQHILVAVDLSEESNVLIDKAVKLASRLEAKVSFIHIDVNFAELYSGLIDINMAEAQHQAMETSREKLDKLASYAGYPITHTFVGSGDLGQELCDTIGDYQIDLLVCGHHQDFWSKWLSSTRQLINCSPVDMLVIPLREES
ncbi:universal stress protein [Vibrio sp. SM6]|uniref:Universal stress protein n=1 Tax=Vibrio agarilyticus TaxID=2726741 RepID=A0A7X8TTR2_9VIBR|nr:universal stress protein [Vibrio agarilyticus]NLS14446.1 universal stress protein [Vibrio agarilyticus]